MMTMEELKAAVEGCSRRNEADHDRIAELEAVLQDFYDYGYDRQTCEQALEGKKGGE